MEELLKKLLASYFAYRIKLQYYHWNVEGPDFAQYHTFFGDLYTAADANIDLIAEHIRAIGAYAPGSFERYSELSTVDCDDTIPSAIVMVERTRQDTIKILDILKQLADSAEEEKARGILNFVEGLIDSTEKDLWMLTATTKKDINK